MSPQPPVMNHESGQLRAGLVTSFKSWLMARGTELRAARSTDEQNKLIHFWVCIPGTEAQKPKWVTVREDANDKNIYALTHIRLRSLVAMFVNECAVIANAAQDKQVAVPQARSGADRNKVAILVRPKVSTPVEPAPVAADAVMAELNWDDFVAGHKLPTLSGHLQDLRDDFAATCPLQLLPGESPAAFAGRRWVYAQAMVESRPA